MKKRYYVLLLLLMASFLFIFNIDVAWAADTAVDSDVILDKDGFADKTKGFAKVVVIMLILGVAFSWYVLFKKSK